MTREINFENKIYIIDYETKTIHPKTVVEMIIPGLNEIKNKQYHIPFNEYKGVIYFSYKDKWYKIINDKVLRIFGIEIKKAVTNEEERINSISKIKKKNLLISINK